MDEPENHLHPSAVIEMIETESDWNAFAASVRNGMTYEGKTVKNTDVKKGLELHKYYDSNVQSFTDCDETIPSYFHVTDVTKKTSEENYPKFGQSASIAGDGSDVSQSIAFIPESEDNRDTTGYYVYKYTLNLWIEGEDAEARRSMNKGVFNLELSFGN